MPLPLPNPTWVLVADASQAHVLQIHSLDGPLTAVPDLDMVATDTHGFARDLNSDRPGRSFASADNRRSAMEPHEDPHQAAKDRFARTVADRINRACTARQFAQLVVIAPPHMLGVLRHTFSEPVRAATAAEIDKDLVKADRADILAHVKSRLA